MIASPNTKPESVPALKPEWIRIPEAVRLSGMSRSKIYELMNAGRIRNSSLAEEGQTKGPRLISYRSLMSLIESRATGGQEDAAAK
ncbi:MAG: AlpA family phage regulatory protein [Verrucomicrobiales bacterium]|nr:AlpA family phage regulatory protein [Verrucomicrobiales bacterium]